MNIKTIELEVCEECDGFLSCDEKIKHIASCINCKIDYDVAEFWDGEEEKYYITITRREISDA